MNPVDRLALAAYGMTRSDAWKDRVCLCCKRSTDVCIGATDGDGAREWALSALCPRCFDEALPPDDE